MTIVPPNRHSFSLIAAIAITASLSGCATIVGESRDQRVHIDSEPRGAQVKVDGQSRGVTPLDVDLSRRQEHQVQLDVPDRPPYVATLKPGCNPWVFGNLFAGGLVGLAVDASTGAASALYPKEVRADFVLPSTTSPTPVVRVSGGVGPTPTGVQPAHYPSPSGLQPIP